MTPVRNIDSQVARARPGIARLMLARRTMRSAAKVALIVGTVLNAINYGEQLWVQHSASLWHLIFNFVVPYLVSSYSAARSEWAAACSLESRQAVDRE
jgi:hypothetical protein